MARTAQLIFVPYDQNEIRARGRVFFDLVRAGVSLAISLALHFLVLQWLVLAGPQSGQLPKNQQILLSFLNAELTQSLGNGLAPIISEQAPEKHEMPATPLPPVTPPSVKTDETALPQPRISPEIYYPRSALSHPPKLIDDVDLSSLEASAGNVSKNVILELFVSEQGAIDRIAIESGALDETVHGKLEELLLQLRFSGGEIDGIAVKSRIRIEVMFLAPPNTEERITLPGR